MNSITKYIAALICLVYILLGAGLVWGKGAFSFSSNYSLAAGIILIAYGIFRLYRIYQKYFS
ncbi:MAG: hypothetical protein JST43_13395 [Bacteroidetes bacterium]|nr:hypothetical protein [Bacteroidota bacterium]MBS1541828.1 hypothetical protein [Bacteroidota bacterium]